MTRVDTMVKVRFVYDDNLTSKTGKGQPVHYAELFWSRGASWYRMGPVGQIHNGQLYTSTRYPLAPWREDRDRLASSFKVNNNPPVLLRAGTYNLWADAWCFYRPSKIKLRSGSLAMEWPPELEAARNLPSDFSVWQQVEIGPEYGEEGVQTIRLRSRRFLWLERLLRATDKLKNALKLYSTALAPVQRALVAADMAIATLAAMVASKDPGRSDQAWQAELKPYYETLYRARIAAEVFPAAGELPRALAKRCNDLAKPVHELLKSKQFNKDLQAADNELNEDLRQIVVDALAALARVPDRPRPEKRTASQPNPGPKTAAHGEMLIKYYGRAPKRKYPSAVAHWWDEFFKKAADEDTPFQDAKALVQPVALVRSQGAGLLSLVNMANEAAKAREKTLVLLKVLKRENLMKDLAGKGGLEAVSKSANWPEEISKSIRWEQLGKYSNHGLKSALRFVAMMAAFEAARPNDGVSKTKAVTQCIKFGGDIAGLMQDLAKDRGLAWSEPVGQSKTTLGVLGAFLDYGTSVYELAERKGGEDLGLDVRGTMQGLELAKVAGNYLALAGKTLAATGLGLPAAGALQVIGYAIGPLADLAAAIATWGEGTRKIFHRCVDDLEQALITEVTAFKGGKRIKDTIAGTGQALLLNVVEDTTLLLVDLNMISKAYSDNPRYPITWKEIDQKHKEWLKRRFQVLSG